MTLSIPAQPVQRAAPSPTGSGSYVVKSGDSFYTIARDQLVMPAGTRKLLISIKWIPTN